MSGIYNWMILENFDYVVQKIKAPLLKAIVSVNSKVSFIQLVIQAISFALAVRRYPKPTHARCNNMNTHFFIDLFDEFLQRQNNPDRRALFEAMVRIFLCEYEHDVSYKRPIDWLLLKTHEGILGRKLKLHPPDKNTIYWKTNLGG